MISWPLLLLFSFLAVIPFTLASPKKYAISGNTSTFVSRDLGLRVEDYPQIRSSAKYPFMKELADVNHKKSKKKKSKRLVVYNNEDLMELRETLIRSVLESDTYHVQESLYGLYDEFPEIDHINELYEDENTGVSQGLLHFAVSTRNFELVNVLVEFGIDSSVKDAYHGYTALELAHYETLVDFVYYIIRKVDGALEDAFFGYETILHHAAANGRIDLFKVVNKYLNFSFAEESQEWSPLEIAWRSNQIEVAKYLTNLDAFFRPQLIQLIHLNNLSNPNNFQTALFMCYEYPGLVYLKHDHGLDLMLAAILHNRPNIVWAVLEMNFNEDLAGYKLLNEAMRLNASDSIMELIKNKQKL